LDKERRDRAGYARRPIAEDEFGVWDKITAWPED
ncbi:MAG: CopG family transcriptional regulator, partial [Candidatus Rokuibacteriota bacterium]